MAILSKIVSEFPRFFKQKSHVLLIEKFLYLLDILNTSKVKVKYAVFEASSIVEMLSNFMKKLCFAGTKLAMDIDHDLLLTKKNFQCLVKLLLHSIEQRL
jgi:hypothetical protein